MRGIWSDYSPEPCERRIVSRGRRPSSTSTENFLRIAYSINDMWSKNDKGEVNKDKTIAMRRTFMQTAKLGETHDLYPTGFGIFYDKDGLPWYGELPK